MAKNNRTARRYLGKEKAAVLRTVRKLRAEPGTNRGAAQRVAPQSGCGVEALKSWVGLAMGFPIPP